MNHFELIKNELLKQELNKQELNKEIEEKENLARDYKQWLEEHPDAALADKNEIRRRLFNALQAINDLVCKLKPSEPYTIR